MHTVMKAHSLETQAVIAGCNVLAAQLVQMYFGRFANKH